MGINPSKGSTRSKTLDRLSKWAEKLGIEYFSFVNCVHTTGVYKPADIDYNTLMDCAQLHDKVLALGNFPSRALEILGIEHFVLPHPSGLNRKLNDPAYEKQKLSEAKRYIDGNHRVLR